MTTIEERMRELQHFILKNRNRKDVALAAGVALGTVSYFINNKRSVSLSKLLAIERAVIKMKKADPYLL
jgi:transcriptional regulator with XRE-family HTH domain